MKAQMRGILICLALVSSLHAMDNDHWYRTPFFFGEPRLSKDALTSFDIHLAAGSTCKSRDACGCTTALLNFSGLHNMHDLGKNVPGKSMTNPLDLVLMELERTPMRDCFAQLRYGGQFKLAEAMLVLDQNIIHGFFVHCALPLRRFKLQCVAYADMSPTDSICPNDETQVWQMFLSSYANILQRWGVNATGYTKHGIGDFVAMLGWTANYQDLRVLDYVDMTIKAGILAPTAHCVNPDQAFDIPFGYNGHVGFPCTFDLSIGAYDWLTLGGHLGVLCFADHTQTLRMKTDVCQNGFIKLAKGCANVDEGTIWEGGAFIKADHIVRGLSFLFGYQFNKQFRNTLCPGDPSVFDKAVVNTDSLLCGWQMHTLHFMINYDFAKEHSRFGPRIGVFYNKQIGGKRVFDLSTGGGSLGLDINYLFD